jgi:F-type H+-transporting ATPase subunit a
MQGLSHLIGFLKSSGTARSGGEEEAAHELPNLITVLNQYVFGGTSVGEFLHHWENAIFSLAIVANAVELIIEALENFIVGVIGPHGRKFVPFLGTLFLYIFCSNLAGLIPLMKAPTANVNQTIALAICVFLYVQFTAMKENGPIGFLKHRGVRKADEPVDPFVWQRHR